MIIAGDVGAIICGKAKISLSPFRSRVNRYIIEQSPMHRFLRTCRNKGGTWPVKKKMMPPETQGLEAKRERGYFCRRIIALKSLSTLSRFYISCKLIASLLRQPIWSWHFEINASQTCDWLATNVEPALCFSLPREN